MLDDKKYRITRIPKGKNQYRTLYIAEPCYKERLCSYLPYLQLRNLELEIHRTCHAFMRNRNCVTNAIEHLGYEYCVSLDIKNFFDSVRPHHVEGKIPFHIINDCFIDNAPRQGLPTSPLIANIALIETDREIIESLKALEIDFKYTRYADDICISFGSKKCTAKIIHVVKFHLAKNEFEVNDKKTKIQSLKNGRIIITGVAIDNRGLHATRKTRRKIRAARHQNNSKSLRGLEQWSQCKLPTLNKKTHKATKIELHDTKIRSCEYCKEYNLIWARINRGRFRLVEIKSKKVHQCRYQRKKYDQQDLRAHLYHLKFEEFEPLSDKWSKGMARVQNGKTLYVMFRKRGIDLYYFPDARPIYRDEGGFVSLNGGDRECMTYDKSSFNVHDYIIEKVSRFLEEELTQRMKIIL